MPIPFILSRHIMIYYIVLRSKQGFIPIITKLSLTIYVVVNSIIPLLLLKMKFFYDFDDRKYERL